ncbi:MAG: DUF1932 domain-containing protein [Gammaproteobacteria bacterium]|nr:DUF1932 domain-containing protein [Gammaproteobacteria bacterium]
MNILLLHPGAMGASVGAALLGNGHDVTWVSANRSAATRDRADRAGLRAVPSLDEALDAEIVISVCPPDAAVALAQSVTERGFAGVYVDGNAVSPDTAAKVERLVGDQYVDGGIVGPPAWREGTTRFYLSGNCADRVASLFDNTLVDARVVDGGPGAASALKMCYAAYAKGSIALILGVRALAESNGVGNALLDEWDISQPGLVRRSETGATATSLKAWRFVGEMHEIASTFSAANLPCGFHQAAAELYGRMAKFKDIPGGADVDTVLRAILKRD